MVVAPALWPAAPRPGRRSFVRLTSRWWRLAALLLAAAAAPPRRRPRPLRPLLACGLLGRPAVLQPAAAGRFERAAKIAEALLLAGTTGWGVWSFLRTKSCFLYLLRKLVRVIDKYLYRVFHETVLCTRLQSLSCPAAACRLVTTCCPALFPDFRACTTSSMALLHAASSLPAARNCFPIFALGVLATEAHTAVQDYKPPGPVAPALYSCSGQPRNTVQLYPYSTTSREL
jgi:hypothetical protein